MIFTKEMNMNRVGRIESNGEENSCTPRRWGWT